MKSNFLVRRNSSCIAGVVNISYLYQILNKLHATSCSKVCLYHLSSSCHHNVIIQLSYQMHIRVFECINIAASRKIIQSQPLHFPFSWSSFFRKVRSKFRLITLSSCRRNNYNLRELLLKLLCQSAL